MNEHINEVTEPLLQNHTIGTGNNFIDNPALPELPNPPVNFDVNQHLIPQKQTKRSAKRSIIIAGILGILINYIFLGIGFSLFGFFSSNMTLASLSLLFVCISAEIICGYIGQRLYDASYQFKRYLGGRAAAIGAFGSVLPFFSFFAFFAIAFGSSDSISSKEYAQFFSWLIPIFLLTVCVISIFGELGAYLASKKFH